MSFALELNTSHAQTLIIHHSRALRAMSVTAPLFTFAARVGLMAIAIGVYCRGSNRAPLLYGPRDNWIQYPIDTTRAVLAQPSDEVLCNPFEVASTLVAQYAWQEFARLSLAMQMAVTRWRGVLLPSAKQRGSMSVTLTRVYLPMEVEAGLPPTPYAPLTTAHLLRIAQFPHFASQGGWSRRSKPHAHSIPYLP